MKLVTEMDEIMLPKLWEINVLLPPNTFRSQETEWSLFASIVWNEAKATGNHPKVFVQ